MNFTIESIEYHQRSGFGIGGAWKDNPIWVAVVKVGKITLGFSRFDSENEWLCDYQFNGGLPVFCHGEGSRSCLKQAAKGELQIALDKAKENYSGGLKNVHGVA
jgi:hypothetical protein